MLGETGDLGRSLRLLAGRVQLSLGGLLVVFGYSYNTPQRTG